MKTIRFDPSKDVYSGQNTLVFDSQATLLLDLSGKNTKQLS